MRVGDFISTVLHSQELRVGSPGSGVRHSFPPRELELEGDPAQFVRGWVSPGLGGKESRGGRNKELGKMARAVRLLKTVRGHPDVAEQRKATDELSDGKGRRALPLPNLPPANYSCHFECQPMTQHSPAICRSPLLHPQPPTSEESVRGRQAEWLALTRGPLIPFLAPISGHKQSI